MNVHDRVALLLGRAVIRAEALQAELDQARAELEKAKAKPAAKPRPRK